MKKKSQNLIPQVKNYFDIVSKYNFDVSKLKKYDLILFYSLYGGRDGTRLLSMDYIEFYNYLFNKNQGAFTKKPTERRTRAELHRDPFVNELSF